MLSISNIGSKQASSYYNKDGYYVRDEKSDRWQGNLQEALCLPTNVERADFDRLILERKERSAYDLCFSAPKSLSVAMCMNEEHRRDMLAAHNMAVKEILGKIEAREIGTRVRNKTGQHHVKTGKMIAGLFNHYVSRNADPQLHTHAVILNKTQYDNKWYAVDNPDLYKNKILYGQLYRNRLAKELMDRGYEVIVTDAEKGFFELRGVPQEAIEQFSSRRQEIVQKLREWGTDTPEAAERASLLTRQAKEHKNLDKLLLSWKETLADMGVSSLEKSEKAIDPTIEQKHRAFEQGIAFAANRSFAFTEAEAQRAILAAGVGSGMTEEEQKDFWEAAKENKPLICLSNEQGKAYYTTPHNLEMEKKIFRHVSQTKKTFPENRQTDTERVLDRALTTDQTELSHQQRQAVLQIVATRDQYIAVQGLAGTGKTHMLNYAREALETEGYTVRGACFTGKAAQGLETDAKIASTTIHAFLNCLEKEAGNTSISEDQGMKKEWNLAGLNPGKRKEAWIIDEASMVDNSTLSHVMEAAKIKAAKVVLVGDRQQLLPIGMGNAFATLIETKKIETVILDEIRRQKNPELLQAVHEAVGGDLRKSLILLEKEIHVVEKRSARLKNIVSDYIALSPEEQHKTVILTAANKDRQQINSDIRKELVKCGQLNPGQGYTVADVKTGKATVREFAPGDKVVFLQNDYRLGVRNGQTGVIQDLAGDMLIIVSGRKKLMVNLEQYNKIDHGYAMTGHKAQGITVDRVLLNLDSEQKQLNSRNAYYVDISRARHEVKIYTDNVKKMQSQIQHFAKKLTSEDFSVASVPQKTLIKDKRCLIEHLRDIKLPEIKNTLKNEMTLRR